MPQASKYFINLLHNEQKIQDYSKFILIISVSLSNAILQ